MIGRPVTVIGVVFKGARGKVVEDAGDNWWIVRLEDGPLVSFSSSELAPSSVPEHARPRLVGALASPERRHPNIKV